MLLTIIRGLPGSGKTTYAKNNYKCLHIEKDMFAITDGNYLYDRSRVDINMSIMMKMLKMCLDNGNDCVVSDTFTRVWEFKMLINIAVNAGAKVHVIKMTESYKNIHNVPQSKIDEMKNRWEDYPGEYEQR